MSRLWDIFQDIDTSDDRRIELAEFTAGFAKMGYPLTEDAAKDAFTAIDKNGGGMIMFGEFCRYIVKLINPIVVDFEDGTVADAPANAEKPAETAEAAESADQQPAEAAPAAEDSNNNDDDAKDSVDEAIVKAFLEEGDEDFKAIVDNLNNKDKYDEWWKDLDQNGNGIVSLSEIQKFVRDQGWKVEAAPLMQAYKFTTAKGDDFVQKNEFPRLVHSMVFMGRLWDIFQDIDSSDDRRIELDEFSAGFAKMGCKLTDDAAKAAFGEIDRNGGGKILFGEFCRYIAKLYGSEAIATGEAVEAAADDQ
jgi:Ca2+-binding EF-hand superfamily protein